MLRLESVSKSYNGMRVLSNISLSVVAGQKVALIGANGSGKSTLLKIMAGLEEPDSGKFKAPDRTGIGYLPQELGLDRLETIGEYLKDYCGFLELEREMFSLEGRLGDASCADKYSELHEQFLEKGGYEFESKMHEVLAGLGMNSVVLDRSLDSLSGGQKTKVALAGVLLKGSHLLLLDEPTNNLDLPSTLWLESFLKKSKASCVMVSHDRCLVDRVAQKVIEIEWYERRAIEYKGGYSDYLAYKEQKIAREEAQRESQEEEIGRLERSAKQKQGWGDSGRYQTMKDNDKYIRGANRDRASKASSASKGLTKKIEEIELIEPLKRRESLNIPLIATDVRGQITLTRVVAGYDGFKIGPIDLQIGFGERVGILGMNGCGKSTLLKVITGELKQLSGGVRIGTSLVIGNLMQQHEDIPRNVTTVDYLIGYRGMSRQESYHLLKLFHFLPEHFEEPISSLSPGERARLLLLSFASASVNVLILDEPTNHLDLDALEALETMLETYRGTVVFVSHDRYFLDKVKAAKLYDLNSGQLRQIMDYESYLGALIT